MSLPNIGILKAILDKYLILLKESEAAVTKQGLNIAKNFTDTTLNFISRWVSPAPMTLKEQKISTPQQRNETCMTLMINFQNAKTVKEWIEIIYSLGSSARKAQEGVFSYSRLSQALHAARTYILFCLNDDDMKEEIISEIKKRQIEFEAADKKEYHIKRQGYLPESTGGKSATSILLEMADLGDESSILIASDRNLFNQLLEFPERSLAPTTPFIDGVSEQPKWNVHKPWCYQTYYFEKYAEIHEIDFNHCSPYFPMTAYSSASSHHYSPTASPRMDGFQLPPSVLNPNTGFVLHSLNSSHPSSRPPSPVPPNSQTHSPTDDDHLEQKLLQHPSEELPYSLPTPSLETLNDAEELTPSKSLKK